MWGSDDVLLRIVLRMGNANQIVYLRQSRWCSKSSFPLLAVFFYKDENWAGEFVDIHGADSIPHHAVIRVVAEKPSPQVRKELLLNT